MTRLRARIRQDDDGSILIITLLVLVVVGVLMAALLTSTDAGLRTAKVVDAQRLTSYSAEGAVQGAINNIRGALEQGRDPDVATQSCPEFVLQETNDVATRVTCTGRKDSGRVVDAGSTGGGTAVRLVGTNAGEIGLAQTSNSELLINGDVEVNGATTISASSARMLLPTSSFTGLGACPTSKIDAPQGSVTCEHPATPAFTAPNVARQGVSLGVGAVPACSTTTAVYQLEPGLYQDAAALSALTSCDRSLVHFKPGVYYFDFTDALPVWAMTSATTNLVGGTSTGLWSTTTPRSALPLVGAGALCQEGEPGVQFVFGASSRVRVASGYVELCPVKTDATKTVIYGATANESVTLTPTVRATTATGAAFSSRADALTTADNKASASATVSETTSFLELTGYNAGVPSGATVNSVILRVAHAEPGLGNGVNPDITATVYGPGITCSAITVPASATYVVLDKDVRSCLTGTTLNSFNVRYAITTGRNKVATTALDGIEILVSYTTAGVRAQSGCITTAGYQLADDSSRCALLTTSGSNTGLVLRGSVFAPLSVLNIALPGASQQRFDNGFVARALRIQVNPSSSYVGPVAAITSGPARPAVRNDRIVDFIAYDAAGAELLRATATFVDDNGLAAGREVRITAWRVDRG